MSVYDRIAFHAKTNPWKLAMAGLGSFAETLSYGEFDLIVRRVAAYLHRNRVGADMRVGVICDDMFLQIIVSCALSHMGIEEIVQSDTGKLAGGAADVLVSDRPASSEPARTIVIDSAVLASPLEADVPAAANAWSHGASWVFLNRTAAGPDNRALRLREDVWTSRILRRSRLRTENAGARWLVAMDIRTETGLSAIFEILWTGGAVLLSSGRLEDDIQLASLYQADCLLISVSGVGEYLKIFEQTAVPRLSLRHASVAGFNFDDRAMHRMKLSLANHLALHLDSPETGPVAECSNWRRGAQCLFRVLPEVKVRIAGRGGETNSADGRGRLAVYSDVPFPSEASADAADHRDEHWIVTSLSAALSNTGDIRLS